MPRWEPNPRERLERAALELFAQQGYDATTVEQIAAGAGLARSTFFRHFGDKREILFGGQDGLATRLATGIDHAPPGSTALGAVEAAFVTVAADVFTPDRRGFATQRMAVVAAHPELRERELLKLAGMVDMLTGRLLARGVKEPAATMAAELATLTLTRALDAWTRPGATEKFDTIARRTLRRLHRAAIELG